MISRTRSRIATSNPSRREPSWPTSLTMLAFAMAYSSCALNLRSRDSGLSPLLTSQENTPSLFLQESGRSLILAKNHVLLPEPAPVQFAEATVAVAFRMDLPVFFPSQLQSEMTMLLELLVECGKVGKDALPPFDGLAITEKCCFDAFFVPAFRQWPADPGRRRFLQVVMDRTLANRTSSGDLSLPQLEFKAEAQDFLDLTHGHSPGWHSVSPIKVHRRNSLPGMMSSATSPCGKHSNFIVITIPGITKN